MRRVPRLTKSERAILEAGMADGSRNHSHINQIPGGTEVVNDQMARLVGRGLAEWTLKPARAMNNRVRRGHIRVTHAGQEALRLDRPLLRTAVWLFDGVPRLLWALVIVGASAAATLLAQEWLREWLVTRGFIS